MHIELGCLENVKGGHDQRATLQGQGQVTYSKLTFRFGFGPGPDGFTGFGLTPEPRTGL